MNYERLPQFSEAKYNFYAANGNFQSQVDALYIILNSGYFEYVIIKNMSKHLYGMISFFDLVHRL